MSGIFIDLTLMLIAAGVIAVVVSFFKQPNIIAYIITGLVVGPLGYYKLHQPLVFDGLAQIGITLLLFMVGLELDISQLKKIGRTALYTGLGQVIITTLAGFAILKGFGFTNPVAWFIAPALTFSSTIIVVKLLGEKRDLQSLYGKIVVGVFLLQDFVAILIVMMVSSLNLSGADFYGNLPPWQNIVLTFVRGLILVLLVSWLAVKVFPRVLSYIGKNEELLLIFALSYALGLAAFVSLPFMGFTLEIGGFLAGLSLARSAVHYEISAKIKSLRDFFIIIFFIVLGSQLVLTDLSSALRPAIFLSIFILIGNPLIVMLLLALQGYKPRTGFLAGVTVAQVSEFSLIMMTLGRQVGILNSSDVGLVTMVAIITIGLSSYMIKYNAKLAEILRPALKVLDFRKGVAEKGLPHVAWNNHIVLVGAHRTGSHLIDALEKQKEPFLVIDFNPEIVESLLERHISAICGDITDAYIQEQAFLDKARIIISTVPDLEDNLTLIDIVKKDVASKRHKPKLVFLAQDEQEAALLYAKDIDYVISPHFMSGLHLVNLLKEDHNFKGLKKLKENHLKIMAIRAS